LKLLSEFAGPALFDIARWAPRNGGAVFYSEPNPTEQAEAQSEKVRCNNRMMNNSSGAGGFPPQLSK
ncbi:hypothetical protein, partial [Bradyrhizobium japonicum]